MFQDISVERKKCDEQQNCRCAGAFSNLHSKKENGIQGC